MFYQLLKVYARLVIRIYCVRIRVNRPEVFRMQGPLLLAANHPNSFLDGIILATLFDRPLYALARGDAFKHKRIDRLLRALHLLPVYRTSEGVENLGHNYTTFEACRKSFERKEDVLIFSEGRCENEWHLRPLKKGTARLSITSWNQGIPLTVLPTGINYSSFKDFGKEVVLLFGDPIHPAEILSADSEGKKLLAFNESLNGQLRELVYEIDPADRTLRHHYFSHGRKSELPFLALPAAIGWLLHAPLFYPCLWITRTWFADSGHYDSVLTSLLILLYPIYLLLMIWIGWQWLGAWSLLCILLAPVMAWSCTQFVYRLRKGKA